VVDTLHHPATENAPIRDKADIYAFGDRNKLIAIISEGVHRLGMSQMCHEQAWRSRKIAFGPDGLVMLVGVMFSMRGILLLAPPGSDK
jgi:hypothetical protein